MAGILFIISAPSGSGKSTLVSEVRKQLTGIEFSVSWTTRPPRGSEQDGREYHFTTREGFERMLAAGEFLEHAEVFGNYYGTARASLEQARRERRRHQQADILRARGLSEQCHISRTATELRDVFLHPPQRGDLVEGSVAA